jgi:hypothetical protein
MNKTINSFIVERRAWARGNGSEGVLLSSDGKKSCLGFYALALGMPEQTILEVGNPAGIRNHWPLEAEWLMGQGCDSFDSPSHACDRISIANESENFTEDQREIRLVELFAQQGIFLFFVDELPCAAVQP